MNAEPVLRERARLALQLAVADAARTQAQTTRDRCDRELAALQLTANQGTPSPKRP
jgi:hypothetical protein